MIPTRIFWMGQGIFPAIACRFTHGMHSALVEQKEKDRHAGGPIRWTGGKSFCLLAGHEQPVELLTDRITDDERWSLIPDGFPLAAGER